MKTFLYPAKNDWANLLKRPTINYNSISNNVHAIMQAIQEFGDQKLFEYTRQFDGVALSHLKVTEKEIEQSVFLVNDDLKEAIKVAIQNIFTFHQTQTTPTQIIETMQGVQCWRKAIAIDKVGLYIPGGTAPLFSTLLML